MDKINFSNTNHINLKLQANSGRNQSFKMKSENDTFVKSSDNEKVTGMKPKKYTKGDIVEILAAHSYKKLVQGLITRGMDTNSQGVVILNTNKNGETTVHVALKTFDEQEGEDHKFTPKEFLEIVKNAGEEIVKKNPEQREAVDRLYAKLAERFEDFKKNDV